MPKAPSPPNLRQNSLNDLRTRHIHNSTWVQNMAIVDLLLELIGAVDVLCMRRQFFLCEVENRLPQLSMLDMHSK